MPRFSSVSLGLAAPLMVLSQAALADLTPAQVWGDWRSYMEGVGYQITATETASGDDLVVSDITMAFSAPDNTGDVAMSVGSIAFNQNSDGTVAIVMPETLPITIQGTDSSTDEAFTMKMNYTQSGHVMTASGSPEQMTYLYNAATIAVTLEEMTAGDDTLGPDDARMTMNGTNLTSTTTMTIGDVRGYNQTGSLQAATYALFFKDPDTPGAQADVSGRVDGITISGTGTIPNNIPNAADMSAMLAAGFDVTGTIGYSGGSSSFDIQDPENGNFQMQTSSEGGSLGVEMGKDGLTYDVSQQKLNAGVTVEGMPFPFEVAMAESGFKLAMPVAKSDEPQDFGLALTLGDFTMSDMIWSMFDPAAQLPRDPATVLLDVSGKMKLLVDWMNPEAAAQMTGAPGELEALTLSNLLVNAVGARLEGGGAVTFDGTGPAMVPGMGSPVGEVNLNLAGGNALLDKLVAMGLLPEDQAMGARMMMGLFAVPGDTPDSLKSRIEFTQEGQILANGQRIR